MDLSKELVAKLREIFATTPDVKIVIGEERICVKRPGTILDYRADGYIRLLFRGRGTAYREDRSRYIEHDLRNLSAVEAAALICDDPPVQDMISSFKEHTYTEKKEIPKILIKPATSYELRNGFVYAPKRHVLAIYEIRLVGHKKGSKYFVDPKVPGTEILYQIHCANEENALFTFVTDAKSYVMPCTDKMFSTLDRPKPSADLHQINELDLELIRFAIDNMAIGCLDTNRT